MPKKILAPIDAKSFKQICSLPRDSFSTKGHWMLVDVGEVIIYAQRIGEPSTGKLSIPKSEFDKLIRWYITGKVTGNA